MILKNNKILKDLPKGERSSNNMYEQTLYKVLDNYIKPATLKKKNRAKSWKHGYDEDHDMVIISKTGKIGDIYEIQNLKIALPLEEKTYKFKDKKWGRLNTLKN